MAVQFREYTSEKGFCEDFHRVWEFLVRINQENVIDEGFLWGRWEWMFCLRRYLDQVYLNKMGMGRAAVLEAVKRCKELGAERAYVGSSQQFNYRIGFRPCSTKTLWERKE